MPCLSRIWTLSISVAKILASESRIYKETTEQQNRTNEGLQTLNRRFSQMEQQQEDRGSFIMDELSRQNHKLSNASQVLASLEHESYDCRERTAQLNRGNDEIFQTLDNMSQIQRRQEELCNTSNGLLLNISRDLAEAYVVTERRDQMSFETLSGVAVARREQINSSEQILQSLGQMQQSQRELRSTSDQLVQSSFLDMNASSFQMQQRQEEINDNIMSELSEQKRELNNVSQVLLRIETASEVSKEVSKETSIYILNEIMQSSFKSFYSVAQYCLFIVFHVILPCSGNEHGSELFVTIPCLCLFFEIKEIITKEKPNPTVFKLLQYSLA